MREEKGEEMRNWIQNKARDRETERQRDRMNLCLPPFQGSTQLYPAYIYIHNN